MRKVLLGVIVAMTLTMSACGGTDTPGPTQAPPTPVRFPVTVTDSNGKSVTIPARPQAIVSLAPTATEMLFAVGAGAQVIAVDDQSNYPAEAPKTTLSGFTPNVEAIAGYRPDLVVLSGDTQGVVAGLSALDIPVLLLEAANTLEEAYDQITTLGAATGHPDEAATVVVGMRSDIQEILAGLPKREDKLSYYHELDDTLFTATSQTFIGEIYALAGLENIADAVDDGGHYPQLSREYLIDADPDLIFLADTKCCGQSATTVAGRPGWAALSAVKNGRVIGLDDDIASRWGPRVVDFLRAVADAVAKVPAPVPTG